MTAAHLPSGIELRTAWPDPDEELRAAVQRFWLDNRALEDPAEARRRSGELCCVALLAGEVVGVTTTWVERIQRLRAPLYCFRVFVSPAHRRRDLALGLTVATRDVLEDHASRHPDGAGLGLLAVVQARELHDQTRRPHWERTRLHLIGYDPAGNQVRVYWFPHAQLPPG